MTSLYPQQELSNSIILAALKTKRAALNLGCTGSGKTIGSIEIAKKMQLPTLIICPLSVIPTWEYWCNEQEFKPLGIINYEKLRSKNNIFCRKIGNQWAWNLDKETLLIWDESARLKSYNSIINRVAVSAKPMYNLLLSATIAESAVHMRATGYLLGLHNLRSYWCWAKERGCQVDAWGKLVFNGDKKHLAQLHNEIVPAHGHGLTLEDLEEYFPQTQITFESVNFGDDGEIHGLYETMADEIAVLESSIKKDKKGAEALTIQLRARQRTELLKVPLLIERTQELIDEGRSVVVFCVFNATLDALKKAFPFAGMIRGDQKPEEREQAVQDFQADKLKLVLANVAAGGVGISLHGKNPRASLITLSWNGPDTVQCLGRVHRAGGSFSQQWILSATGTIEERVAASVKEKISNMKLLNEGIATIPKEPCAGPFVALAQGN